MKLTSRFFRELWLYPVVGFALIAASACNSSPASSGSREASGATTASNDTGNQIDVMCIGDHISNPPESFHYSFLYNDASGSVEKQADITSQTIDTTIKDASGSHSRHGVRSDEASWGNAVLDLSSLNITAMSARLSSLNGTSALADQGRDTVNNYNTRKVSIDTTSVKSADKRKFETLFGVGSFDKGMVWMGADKCAVKLVLDEGIWQANGGVKKVHYEIARVKN